MTNNVWKLDNDYSSKNAWTHLNNIVKQERIQIKTEKKIFFPKVMYLILGTVTIISS